MESMATEEHSLEIQVATFLADLAHSNHSPQTRRAYASDLAQLCAFHQGPIQTRLSRNMVDVDGNFKLANPLVNRGVASYTEQRSTLAPAGVLM
ncbi:MAG: hypothetical protein E6I80_28545 [Chloroflexi bacterium]|nr:MAG: hypothetical protein E6I80_28545 [Chloroflexota bacterium]